MGMIGDVVTSRYIAEAVLFLPAFPHMAILRYPHLKQIATVRLCPAGNLPAAAVGVTETFKGLCSEGYDTGV